MHLPAPAAPVHMWAKTADSHSDEKGGPADGCGSCRQSNGQEHPFAGGGKADAARRQRTEGRGAEGQKVRGAEDEKVRRAEGEKMRRAEGEKVRGAEDEKVRRAEGQKVRRWATSLIN